MVSGDEQAGMRPGWRCRGEADPHPRHPPESISTFRAIAPSLASTELQDQAQRSRCMRDLVRSLPAPNHDTLRLLFQHLCR